LISSLVTHERLKVVCHFLIPTCDNDHNHLKTLLVDVITVNYTKSDPSQSRDTPRSSSSDFHANLNHFLRHLQIAVYSLVSLHSSLIGG